VSIDVARVSVEVKSGEPVEGSKDEVTPAGMPEALNCTDFVLPETIWRPRPYVAVSPAVMFAEVAPVGVIEKSKLGGGGTALTASVTAVVIVTPPPVPTIVSE